MSGVCGEDRIPPGGGVRNAERGHQPPPRGREDASIWARVWVEIGLETIEVWGRITGAHREGKVFVMRKGEKFKCPLVFERMFKWRI